MYQKAVEYMVEVSDRLSDILSGALKIEHENHKRLTSSNNSTWSYF